MSTRIFSLSNYNAYCKAGPTDLIEMIPAENDHPLYFPKYLLETLIESIIHGDFIHLSGPTGVAKSSLIENLQKVPENIKTICKSLNQEYKPLKVHPIEAAKYETPGEWYVRRSLNNGSTCDEDSELVKALLEADSSRNEYCHLIHLREIGRTHSSSVQGGLLNLMTKNDICLSGGRNIRGRGIGWIADSNYQAVSDSVHTLVTLDDALKRRFDSNITFNYLTSGDEEIILDRIVRKTPGLQPDTELTAKIVALGNMIREQRAEGNLQSLVPPTLYGYMGLYRKAQLLKHLNFKIHAQTTLMGNASNDDQKLSSIMINQILGYKGIEDKESVINDILF